jgi:proteasome accessory factor B
VQKLERLLNLTAVLLHSSRPLTVTELRDQVPGYPDSDVAFHRGFERDKDDLREMGIPLDLVPIPGTDPPAEGYRIPRDRYYLPDPGLDPEERMALQLAASAIRLDGVEGIEALWKLGGTESDVPDVPELAALPTDARVPPLWDALSRRAPVRFDYKGQARELEPHRIAFQRGHWYLRGFDTAKSEVRIYRVDRIDGDIEIGAPGAYEPPTDDDPTMILEGWQLGDEPPVHAVLHIDASHVPMALGLIDDGEVVGRGDDGSVDVALTVVNQSAFIGLVLSFLDHAEILGPPSLRDAIVAHLREVPT